MFLESRINRIPVSGRPVPWIPEETQRFLSEAWMLPGRLCDHTCGLDLSLSVDPTSLPVARVPRCGGVVVVVVLCSATIHISKLSDKKLGQEDHFTSQSLSDSNFILIG